MDEQKRAEYLVRLMGKSLATRYVNSKIAHFESDEFISVRSETLNYWLTVKSFLTNFFNPFKD